MCRHVRPGFRSLRDSHGSWAGVARLDVKVDARLYRSTTEVVCLPTEELLEKYAAVAIGVGLGVERGDRVVIASPVQLPAFTRLLVDSAYEGGAESVDVLWFDDQVRRSRFSVGSDAAAAVVSGDSQFRMRAFEAGASYLRVLAEDPSALAGVDTSKVQEHQRVNGQYLKPHMDSMGGFEVPWTVISAPVPAWSATVFPDDGQLEAEEKMWSAIFRACRIDRDDPVAAWRQHLGELNDRRDYLTKRQFVRLRYEGPGTDLVLGMTDRVRWQGGGVRTPSGRPFAPNIPTEEVFTSPHRMKGEGRIQASKPLSYFGDLIDDFALQVAGGRVVEATAGTGQEVLDRVLGTDGGSTRFGEAAMVPQSGAVASEGLVWNNMLYDENDACHIALGQSFVSCFDGASNLSQDDRIDAGLNQSSIHVDFVVGSNELSVFGSHEDGTEEPIISNGEWAFAI
jgi:aminopeptidase